MKIAEFEQLLQDARNSIDRAFAAVRGERIDGFNAATYAHVHRELAPAERAVCRALDETQRQRGTLVREVGFPARLPCGCPLDSGCDGYHAIVENA